MLHKLVLGDAFISGLDKATKGIGLLTIFLTDIDAFCGRHGDVLSGFPSKGGLDAKRGK